MNVPGGAIRGFFDGTRPKPLISCSPGGPFSSKKALVAAFVKSDAYQLATYDRAAPVRLRDVLFLRHARPMDVTQEILWTQLADGMLPSPEASEMRLSACAENADGMRGGLSVEEEAGALTAILRKRRPVKLALAEASSSGRRS